MTAPPPGRPWYRRKRTWAAAAAWLLLTPPAAAMTILLWSEKRPAVAPSVSARLRVGMTQAEIRGLFGPPKQVPPRGDGRQRWVFAGGTPSRHHVEFGPDGRMSGHWEDR